MHGLSKRDVRKIEFSVCAELPYGTLRKKGYKGKLKDCILAWTLGKIVLCISFRGRPGFWEKSFHISFRKKSIGGSL